MDPPGKMGKIAEHEPLPGCGGEFSAIVPLFSRGGGASRSNVLAISLF